MDCHLDPRTGTVRVGDLVVGARGLTRPRFETSAGGLVTGSPTAPGYTTYGPLDVTWGGKRFVLGIRFHEDTLHGLTFTWRDGRVEALGYDASAEDLLAEKKILTALLSRLLDAVPTETSLGADVFVFDWGGVLARADLKSTMASIEVRYP